VHSGGNLKPESSWNFLGQKQQENTVSSLGGYEYGWKDRFRLRSSMFICISINSGISRNCINKQNKKVGED
jgi:hypothetical protein